MIATQRHIERGLFPNFGLTPVQPKTKEHPTKDFTPQYFQFPRLTDQNKIRNPEYQNPCT